MVQSNLDEIGIDLVFEIGRKQILMKDLKKIRVGYTFDLNKQLNNIVAIKANGKKIGEGELVQLDEKIGVRLTEISI